MLMSLLLLCLGTWNEKQGRRCLRKPKKGRGEVGMGGEWKTGRGEVR